MRKEYIENSERLDDLSKGMEDAKKAEEHDRVKHGLEE